jgi:MoxR-like ATPase
VPRILPEGGAGILMLEELNRAERYIQQPALQLLTARRLHEYTLPEGWVCFAAVNPETADYQVTPLDRALRARFMNLSVRADRAAWLAWAQVSAVHPGIIALAQAHERILDDVPPRTWTYASHVLDALTPRRPPTVSLLRDALGGYLPATRGSSCSSQRPRQAGRASSRSTCARCSTELRVRLAARREIKGYRERGQTDRLDELTTRLARLLEGPEAGVLVAQKQLSLASFEALLADLPGDQRERLQDALGHNPTATALVDVTARRAAPELRGQRRREEDPGVAKADPLKQHRAGLAVTALRAHLDTAGEGHRGAAEQRRPHVPRPAPAAAPERWALPLVETLKKLGITPIRPQ